MMVSRSTSIRVIDSHTGGEPTRVVVEGAPDLGNGTMADRRAIMSRSHDWLRTALVNEPRGSVCMVGAILQDPKSPSAAAGVIFFNNVGYLGMCGHGLIGAVATLAYMRRIKSGRHLIETPVGNVEVRLEDGVVAFDNVLSFRRLKDIELKIPQWGTIVGDVAWGGNWFFCANTDRQLALSDVPELTQISLEIRQALREKHVFGIDQPETEHIELIGPPSDPTKADARNFVLCPGGEYDRSPCGTGTSAKLACLAASDKLAPGQIWRQESIVGSVFEARFRHADNGIIPTISGQAFVTGDMHMLFDPRDPFCFGIPA